MIDSLLLNSKRQIFQAYSGRLEVQQYLTNSTHKRGRDKAHGAINFDYQRKCMIHLPNIHSPRVGFLYYNQPQHRKDNLRGQLRCLNPRLPPIPRCVQCNIQVLYVYTVLFVRHQ